MGLGDCLLRVVVWDCYVDLLIVLELRFVVVIIAGVSLLLLFAIVYCFSCGLSVIGGFDGVF